MSGNSGERGSQSGLPDSSEVLDLAELAAKYADCVPFRFQVINGFMAENEKDPTLGVDEVYSVHLVREIKMVTVKVENDRFKVPVTSAAKFGLVPDKDIVTYNGVESIMSRPQLPKVLAVRSTHVNEEETFRLKKGEILLVRGVAKGKFGRGKTGLKVFSMSSYSELILPKSCDAKFSTDPSHTQLYLTDLIENKVDFVPSFARIFPSKNSSLSESLTANNVAIESLEVHRSVIVSLFRDNPSARRRKETSFIDIPTTININVSVIGTDTSDEIYERIFLESEHLLADYNPSKIQACVDASTNDEYMTQAQLLAEIRKEKVAAEIASSAPHQYQKLLPVQKETTSYESVSFPAKSTVPALPEPSSEPVPATTTSRQKAKLPGSQIHEETKKVSVSPQANIQEIKPAALIPNPKPALPRKPQATHKPPPPFPKKQASRLDDIYDNTLSSAPPLLPSTPSQKPVPTKRTNVGSSAKRTDHLYEDLDSWKSQNLSGQASTVNSKAKAFPEKVARSLSSPSPQSRTMPGDSKPETPSTINNAPPEDGYIRFIKNGAEVSDMALLAGQLNEIQASMSEIVNRMNKLEERQANLERELSHLKGIDGGGAAAAITISSSMGQAEVLRALQAAGLSQYCESFSREFINGEIFQVLDEQVLSDELGVKSRLHQVRLMKMKASRES